MGDRVSLTDAQRAFFSSFCLKPWFLTSSTNTAPSSPRIARLSEKQIKLKRIWSRTQILPPSIMVTHEAFFQQQTFTLPLMLYDHLVPAQTLAKATVIEQGRDCDDGCIECALTSTTSNCTVKLTPRRKYELTFADKSMVVDLLQIKEGRLLFKPECEMHPLPAANSSLRISALSRQPLPVVGHTCPWEIYDENICFSGTISKRIDSESIVRIGAWVAAIRAILAHWDYHVVGSMCLVNHQGESVLITSDGAVMGVNEQHMLRLKKERDIARRNLEKQFDLSESDLGDAPLTAKRRRKKR